MRIGPLDTVGGVAGELGRLYREARRGDLDVTTASRLATILATLRACLESAEIEKRLAELEARIDQGQRLQ